MDGEAYGNPFNVYFRNADRTPVTVSNLNSTSLVSGDLVDAAGPIIIKVIMEDPGEDPSGVDLTSILVSVTDSTSTAVAGSTDLTNCLSATNCDVRWTPTTTLTAGSYTVTMTVEDNVDNMTTTTWSVVVTNTNVPVNIVAGPQDGSAVYNPMSGNNMVIAFQAPSAGTVTMELYRRDGQLAYTATQIVNAGHNEILWNGRSLSGVPVANGVYMFRLRAVLTTGTTEQTGKLAVFKQ